MRTTNGSSISSSNGGHSPPADNNDNGNGPRIYALEIEEDDDEEDEIESLMRETADASPTQKSNLSATLARNFNFRHRIAASASNRAAALAHHSSGSGSSSILGLLRSSIGNASSWRNFAVLGFLAVTSLVLMYAMDVDVLETHTPQKTQLKTPHGPSLGGNLNTGHYTTPASTTSSMWDDDRYYYMRDDDGVGYDDMYADYDADDDAAIDDDDTTTTTTNTPKDRLPKSNVGVHVASLSVGNRNNEAGHYLHDIHRSPYASPYYQNLNVTMRAQRQHDFEAQLERYANKYGRYETPAWKPELTQPVVESVPYKDVTEFAATDWILDSDYVDEFLQQAKLLVQRVKEGIYEEYGYGIQGLVSTLERDKITTQRLPAFQVNIIPDDHDVAIDQQTHAAHDASTGKQLPGIAYLSTAAWDALVRKLWHAIVTGDEFYVVVAGSAETYRGNNLAQTQVMQFDYILQPVLNKLGVRLISRNMGMAAPTTINALAGADVYGEADIFWHIDPTEQESLGAVHLLHRQAVLSGERVPILLSTRPTVPGAWTGNLQPGADMCTSSSTIPACRYVLCTTNDDNNDDADCRNQYNSVCWVNRTDHNPPTPQFDNVGHQNEGYPNAQQHRLEGRKLAMLVLHALDEALDRWMSFQQQQVPLPQEEWHVGPTYTVLRELVRTSSSDSACDQLLSRLDPQICHMEMHAYTEWTPRVLPKQRSLKTIVQGRIADNHASLYELYTGVDLLPPQWKLADDEVDVHMIAIAAQADTVPTGDNANAVVVNDDDDDAPGYPWSSDDDHWMDANDDRVDFGWNDDDDGFRRKLKSVVERNLLTHDVSPTQWTLYNAPLGFCDGSAQSTCNRIFSNPCLLANYNHYLAGIMGHGKSGKLKLSIPAVREGLVMARFEWDLQSDGPRLENLPDDFVFKFTVNDQVTIQTRDDFVSATVEVTKGVRVHTLWKDYAMSQNENETKTIDIELEVLSETSGTTPLVLLSHIYYA